MDENSDDPDAEPSASASPVAPGSSHQKGGESDEAAQLRQMLRDNGAGDEGDGDGDGDGNDDGEGLDEDDDQMEEGEEEGQQQQMMKKGSIEITTTTASSTRSHGQMSRPPTLPPCVTITKTN